MITGAHSIIYSTNPEADRVFLRDVIKLPFVDIGNGWLIFGLPSTEVSIHPSDANNVHEFYLICENIDGFVDEMKKHNIACSLIKDQSWGLLVHLTLPGGGKLGVYQARHAHPKVMTGEA